MMTRERTIESGNSQYNFAGKKVAFPISGEWVGTA
jgi:hypothetical protein